MRFSLSRVRALFNFEEEFCSPFNDANIPLKFPLLENNTNTNNTLKLATREI